MLHGVGSRKVAAILSDAQRVIMLAYFEGFSHREISVRLKKPLGTVKSQIRSALLVFKGGNVPGHGNENKPQYDTPNELR